MDFRAIPEIVARRARLDMNVCTFDTQWGHNKGPLFAKRKTFVLSDENKNLGTGVPVELNSNNEPRVHNQTNLNLFAEISLIPK